MIIWFKQASYGSILPTNIIAIERLHVTSSTDQIPEIWFYSLENFFKYF